VDTLIRTVLLGATGVLLGIAGNGFTPHPAPLGKPVFAAAELPGACSDSPGAAARISVEEAKPLCVSCTAAFVDARTPAEYAAGHITSAVHLAPGEPVAPVLGALREKSAVIVYDRDGNCAAADQVAAELQKQGLRDVGVLTGAWPDWLARGGPGESGACTVCAPVSR